MHLTKTLMHGNGLFDDADADIGVMADDPEEVALLGDVIWQASILYQKCRC